MYLIIGKYNCNLCNILTNLLDEKGISVTIRYSYLDRIGVGKFYHRRRLDI